MSSFRQLILTSTLSQVEAISAPDISTTSPLYANSGLTERNSEQRMSRSKHRSASVCVCVCVCVSYHPSQNQLRDLAPNVRSLPQVSQDKRHLVWETGCVRAGGEVWMACTEDQLTHVTVIRSMGQESMEVSFPEVRTALEPTHDRTIYVGCRLGPG